MRLKRPDTSIVLVLLGISLLTHFVGLASPRQVVFDEVHFGKFITAYCCTGERFFDIHPPHAKLLIAGAAWLGGYRGNFSFDHIGQPYDASIPVAALRSVAAITGTLFPLIVYLLLRQLKVGRVVAAIGGAVTVLDNALLIQTRLIALDGVLLCATFGSLACYLAARKTQRATTWWYLIGAGALAGLAIGTKFTGLAALALLGIACGVKLLQQKTSQQYLRAVAEGLVILAAASVVYLAGWALHFSLLPLPGPGDAFHVPTTLLPPASWSISGFFHETFTLHKIMLDANYNLTAGHPSASPWWSWPFMDIPVFYWTDGPAQIYFVGNPVVWWGATLVFIVALLVSVVQFGQRRRPVVPMLWMPVVGYLIAMIPLVRVPRALFLYHYLTPLYFSLLVALVWLERYQLRHRWPAARLRRVAVSIVVIAFAGFLWISPLTYGISLGTTSTGAARSPVLLFWTTQ